MVLYKIHFNYIQRQLMLKLVSLIQFIFNIHFKYYMIINNYKVINIKDNLVIQ